jgi:hypothetical protein
VNLVKASILSTLFSGLLGSLASAAPIATYDFENYAAVDPTWWGNDATNISAGGGYTSTLARIYDVNNALPTGITSISPITFTVGDIVDGQNVLENSARPTGAVNVTSTRYRWRLTGPVVTASFSVTIAPGYSLENFALSLAQTGNATGTFAVTYNGNAMGSGILDSDDNFDGDNDAFTSNTISSSVSGTVNFVVSVDPDAASRTARWDDFVLTGNVVAVPEPTSSALVILGGLAMTFPRRRR